MSAAPHTHSATDRRHNNLTTALQHHPRQQPYTFLGLYTLALFPPRTLFPLSISFTPIFFPSFFFYSRCEVLPSTRFKMIFKQYVNSSCTLQPFRTVKKAKSVPTVKEHIIQYSQQTCLYWTITHERLKSIVNSQKEIISGPLFIKNVFCTSQSAL